MANRTSMGEIIKVLTQRDQRKDVPPVIKIENVIGAVVIHVGTTAPADTTKLWYDTSE